MKGKLVDLSQEIYNGMPVYPGHQRTAIFEAKNHEESRAVNRTAFSSTTMGILMSDHGPTHVDAFSHLDPSPEAETVDRLPLELFYTPAVCLDVSHRKPGEYITVKDLEQASARAGLEVRRGMTLLLYTGHYDRSYPGIDYLMSYPGLNRGAMLWIADKGIVNVGVDSPSIDSSGEMKEKNYPAHTVARERKILNMENLAHLDEVAGREFIFIGFPLLIRGGSGSPIRAVALLPE